jgi:tetratricopeptide (TPR) repeat protein
LIKIFLVGQVNKKEHTRLIYTALAFVTVIVFGQVCRNGFVRYDDPYYVTNNPHVKYGISLESVKWAFTTTVGANWHPLTWLSHILDCQLFGVNPFWHHLINLLFHTANTLLLFWILKKMTGKIWPSAFVAAAFALHPLRVESVAWAAERKDVLSGLFWMLTIVSYIRYTEHKSISRYLLLFVVFGLGLMTKPMLVTLPFVLLLLDYWPLERFQQAGQLGHQKWFDWRLIIEKVPMFVLSAALSIVTYFIQQSAGAMELGRGQPLHIRISNALVSYIAYLGKLIYPSRLAVLYPYPVNELPLWQPILSLLILVFITAGVIYTARRYLAVGWFWYLGTLVPVIGLVQIGNQKMADRYTYLPSIGIFIIIAFGAEELTVRWRHRNIILGLCAGIALSILSILTLLQVKYWRNSLTLYEHAISVTKNNYIMQCNYGILLSEKGRDEEALEHLRIALQINPRYYYVHYGIGTVLLKKGKFAESIEQFDKAIELQPDYHKAYYEKGRAFYLQGYRQLAVEQCLKALQIKPDYTLARITLAHTLAEMGMLQPAVENYYIVLKLEPDQIFVLENLAWLLATTEDRRIYNPSEAVKLAEKACKLTDYKEVEALDTLAVTYAATGRFSEAVQIANKAIEFAISSGEKNTAEKIKQRLELYKSNKPYRYMIQSPEKEVPTNWEIEERTIKTE